MKEGHGKELSFMKRYGDDGGDGCGGSKKHIKNMGENCVYRADEQEEMALRSTM